MMSRRRSTGAVALALERGLHRRHEPRVAGCSSVRHERLSATRFSGCDSKGRDRDIQPRVRVERIDRIMGRRPDGRRRTAATLGACARSRPPTCTRPWATSRARSARSPSRSPPGTASRRSSARPGPARRRRWRGRSRSSSGPRSSSRTTRRSPRSSATSSASSSRTTPSSTSSPTTTTSSPRRTSRRPTSTSRRTRRGTTTSPACGCRRPRRS